MVIFIVRAIPQPVQDGGVESSGSMLGGTSRAQQKVWYRMIDTTSTCSLTSKTLYDNSNLCQYGAFEGLQA